MAGLLLVLLVFSLGQELAAPSARELEDPEFRAFLAQYLEARAEEQSLLPPGTGFLVAANSVHQNLKTAETAADAQPQK